MSVAQWVCLIGAVGPIVLLVLVLVVRVAVVRYLDWRWERTRWRQLSAALDTTMERLKQLAEMSRNNATTCRFAFCEPTTATRRSRWHIREIGPEGLKLGGGTKAPLCGRREHWTTGWDLEVEITEHHLGHACPDCVELYRAALEREEKQS